MYASHALDFETFDYRVAAHNLLGKLAVPKPDVLKQICPMAPFRGRWAAAAPASSWELSMPTLNAPKNPWGRLTAASTMRGSTVFNTALEELGRIEDVIIEEPAGRIAFAILHTGGFLGIGAKHYPLRWEKLRFDNDIGGYIVEVDRDLREGAPSYTDRATASWDDLV